MLDHVIPKPPSLTGYAGHRLIEGLTGGKRALFTDCGDHFLVRSERQLAPRSSPVRRVEDGDVVAFELRASVAKKIKGKRSYYPTSDWKSRHAWIRRKGEQNGFEVLTVHCSSQMDTIDDNSGRRFTIDRTDFVGILRVTNKEAFDLSLRTGVGSTARAFGYGMLII